MIPENRSDLPVVSNVQHGCRHVGNRKFCLGAGTQMPIRSLPSMERIYLMLACAGIVLLTTVIGIASPPLDGAHQPDRVPLLLRTIPR